MLCCACRLGIFVSGRLACIGHPKDITSRFCGYLVRARLPRMVHMYCFLLQQQQPYGTLSLCANYAGTCQWREVVRTQVEP